MQITDRLLTMGANHGRTGKKLVPQGIVVHYVGNPNSTALANRNYFENGSGGLGVSAHYIVGLEGEILRCVPDSEVAQHAGKSYGPQWNEQAKKNNSMYIGIENCHPGADGKFNEKTYNSLVELSADICKRYNFDPMKDIFRHYDVCGKQCPLFYVKNESAWEQFTKDVQIKFNELKNPVVESTETVVKFDLFGAKKVDVKGFIKDGKTYVEARDLLEKMEFIVGWDGVNKNVLVKTR